MEKRKAHYLLDEIKELLSDENSRIVTRRDRSEAVSLGYADDDSMAERVQELRRNEFDKSMTSHHNVRLWQDVYKTRDGDVGLYIKLQKSPDDKGVIVSFKRDEGEDY
ncbi:MAG: type II toxin-antitoxin system MqsR family toxin [bacterium]|nr:type II toxin-antitoxin system MqsR family toxin [bacterium]